MCRCLYHRPVLLFCYRPATHLHISQARADAQQKCDTSSELWTSAGVLFSGFLEIWLCLVSHVGLGVLGREGLF